MAQPKVRAWTAGPPMKVHLLKSEPSDPDPDAVACYGFCGTTRARSAPVRRGRPLGKVTVQFLEWLCWSVAQEGKKVLVVIWDDASWHTADAVARWVNEQNRRAQRAEGVRIVVSNSPWQALANNIEPCWTHAKKAVMELDRKLTAAEITPRVCEHFECDAAIPEE